MKSKEFLNESDDQNIDDVQANHPEIYRFMIERIGYMALGKQSTVEAYNTTNSHMVVIKIQPSAGIGNTRAGLDSDGVQYEETTSPFASDNGSAILTGTIGEMHWTVSDDNMRGNVTETWRFSLPHADGQQAEYHDRTMEDTDVNEGGFFKGLGQKLVSKIDNKAVGGLVDILDSGTNKMEMLATFTQMPGHKQKNLLDAIGRWLEHNDHQGVEDFYNLASPADDEVEIEEDAIDSGEPRDEKMDLHSVFGSDAANALRKEGIKFYEKPSYWSDLDRKAMSKDVLRTAEFALEEQGMPLNEYEAWEIFPINPDNSAAYVKGPMTRVENMPAEKVFVIYDLPYSDERRGVQDPQVGTFLVDTQGAQTYIRSWIMIK